MFAASCFMFLFFVPLWTTKANGINVVMNVTLLGLLQDIFLFNEFGH